MLPSIKRAGVVAVITGSLFVGFAGAAQAATYPPVVAHDDTATVEPGGTVRVPVLDNDEYDLADSIAIQADGAFNGWSYSVDGDEVVVTAPDVSTGQFSTISFGYLLLGSETNSSGQVQVTAKAAPAPVADPDPVGPADPTDGDGPTEGTCPAGQVPTPGSISGCGDGTGTAYTVLCQHDYRITTLVPGTSGTARLGGGVYKRGVNSAVETYTHKAGARLDAKSSGCFTRFQHVGLMGKQTSATSVLTKMLTGSEQGGRKTGPVGLYRVTLTPRMVTCQARGEVLVSCGAPEVVGASVATDRITAKATPTPKTPKPKTPKPKTPETPHRSDVPDPKDPTPHINAGAVYVPVVAPVTHEGGSTGLFGLVFTVVVAAGALVVRRRRVNAR